MIDDSEVETPGDCHLETWVGRWSEDTWHGNVGIGCTPEAVPMLELGGMVGYVDAPGADETVIGLSAKANLRPADTGLGIGVSGSLGYSADRSRLETAALIGAVTLPASDALRFNLNAGWGWSEAGPGSELFAGAQAELTVGPEVTLMAEAFARDHGKAGAQVGLRWTPRAGRFDFDLLAARFHDGATPTSLTVGATVRW